MILSHLADAYEIAGQDDDATSAYERAIALSPEATAYQNLAKLQARRAIRLAGSPPIRLDWSGARASCSAAAALGPGVGATCWKNLGIVLGNAGNFPDAEIALRESTALAPNDPQAWLQLGHTLTNWSNIRRRAMASSRYSRLTPPTPCRNVSLSIRMVHLPNRQNNSLPSSTQINPQIETGPSRPAG